MVGGEGGGCGSNTYEYLHNFPFFWQYCTSGVNRPFQWGTGELDFFLLAGGGLYYDKNLSMGTATRNIYTSNHSAISTNTYVKFQHGLEHLGSAYSKKLFLRGIFESHLKR
jgi:hypothetical protein